MGKKLVITESQLKRLIQYQTKMKLNEGVTFNDVESMSEDELNLDTEDGKFVDDTVSDDATSLPSPLNDEPISDEMSDEDMYSDISLNEGQLKLKDTFNKFIGNPIIKSLSSEIIKK